MKYSCDHCSYETDKKSNYLRHINRKFRCYDTTQNIQDDSQKVQDDSQNIQDDSQNIQDDSQNIQDKGSLVCEHCFKKLGSKFSLDRHKKTCKGFKSNQCPVCLKCFKSAKGKYEHIKNVLCYPPPPPPENESPDNLLIVKESEESTVQNPTPSSVITMSNSQNKIQNTTNSNNNNNTINNNIIQYNAFGDEGIEQLGKFLSGRKDDAKIIEHMRQLGKKKIYGIRDIQNDIFFNPENPEGFSIIKPEKYGSSVRVRNSEGEFEYREFEDVRDPLLNYMEKYIDIYNKTRNKYNVKFRDPKERRILQNFFKIMNDNLEIYLGEDLKEDLNIRDNTSEEDKYKQFEKVSLDNIHVQTKKFYTCKKGEFVLKE